MDIRAVQPPPATLLALLIACCLGLTLQGCRQESPTAGDGEAKLAALKADPMASIELPGVRVTDERETVGHTEEDDWMGKQSPSWFTRDLVIEKGSTRATIQRIQRAAEQNGWTTILRDSQQYYGRKTFHIEGVELVSPAALIVVFGDSGAPSSSGSLSLKLD